MIPLTLDSLHDKLKEKKFEPQIQKETQQINLNIKVGAQEFPVFVRIYEGSNLLQLLLFMPFNLKPEVSAEVARLLHLLNKELDIPGFGMDEAAKLIFFRTMIPTNHQKIDFTIVETYLKSLHTVCQTFFPLIYSINQGTTTLDEVLKKVQEAQQTPKTP